jgi:hypothetical protein
LRAFDAVGWNPNAVQVGVRIPACRLESDFLTASVSEPDPGYLHRAVRSRAKVRLADARGEEERAI